MMHQASLRVEAFEGRPGALPAELQEALHSWLARYVPLRVCLTVRPRADGPGIDVVPDVLVLAGLGPGPWPELEAHPARDAAWVVCTDSASLPGLQEPAAQRVVHFVPEAPTAGCLGLAILGAYWGLQRERELRRELETVEQRLNDRIVIERGKGVLVQRFGVPEAEAYRRLRALARRQRRTIREVAQSLLDTRDLLEPVEPSEAVVPSRGRSAASGTAH
jgi:hypothetical protein